MEYGTQLKEAEANLDLILTRRDALRGLLNQSIMDADDADGIFCYQTELGQVDARIYAAQARVLRLSIKAKEEEAAEVIAERRGLDEAERLAVERYAKAVDVADDARQRLQRVQIKQGSLEARAANLREEKEEMKRRLDELVKGKLSGGVVYANR